MPWPTLGPERPRLGDDRSAGALKLGDPGGDVDADPKSGATALSLAGATLATRQVAGSAAVFDRYTGHGNAPISGPAGRTIPR